MFLLKFLKLQTFLDLVNLLGGFLLDLGSLFNFQKLLGDLAADSLLDTVLNLLLQLLIDLLLHVAFDGGANLFQELGLFLGDLSLERACLIVLLFDRFLELANLFLVFGFLLFDFFNFFFLKFFLQIFHCLLLSLLHAVLFDISN